MLQGKAQENLKACNKNIEFSAINRKLIKLKIRTKNRKSLFIIIHFN